MSSLRLSSSTSRTARGAWAALVLALAACGAEPAPAVESAGLGEASGACSATPASGPGPFTAGFRFLPLVDPSREGIEPGSARQVPVHLWYPADPASAARSPEAVYPIDYLYSTGATARSSEFEAYGIDGAVQEPLPSRLRPFPLVVFSPGWGLDASGFAYLGARLASHGYVVAVLSHSGDGTLSSLVPYDPFAVALLERPRDLSFVLDHLLAANGSRRSPLRRLIRPDQIAAAGHSLGGTAALTLAGGDDVVCDGVSWMNWDQPAWTCVASKPDPRFRAVAHLDGASWFLRWEELARIRVPVIGITQAAETAILRGNPGIHARAHAAIGARWSYRVDVARTTHSSFGNLCEGLDLREARGLLPADDLEFYRWLYCGPTPAWLDGEPVLGATEGYRLVTEYLVAFLRTHLEGERDWRRFLTPRWTAEHEPEAGLFLTERGGETHAGPGLPYLDPTWTDQFDYYLHMPVTAQGAAHREEP